MQNNKLNEIIKKLEYKRFDIIEVKNIKGNLKEELEKYPLINMINLTDEYIGLYIKGLEEDKNYIKEKIMNSNETKNYVKTILYYKELLSIDPSKTYIFGKIGICNLKIQKYEKALKYFKIANHVDKNTDYSKTIEMLENFINSNNYLEKNNNYGFINDVEENYGLVKIEDIRKMVLEDNMSISDTLEKLEIKEYYVPIVALIFAKEFYSKGDYNNGDKYFKIANKSEVKTEFSKCVSENVKTNRLFYKNRN